METSRVTGRGVPAQWGHYWAAMWGLRGSRSHMAGRGASPEDAAWQPHGNQEGANPHEPRRSVPVVWQPCGAWEGLIPTWLGEMSLPGRDTAWQPHGD